MEKIVEMKIKIPEDLYEHIQSGWELDTYIDDAYKIINDAISNSVLVSPHPLDKNPQMKIDRRSKQMELKEGYNGITDPKDLTEADTGYYNFDPETGYATSITQVRTSVFKDCPVYESEEDAKLTLPMTPMFGIAPEKRYLVGEVPTIKVRYHKEICPDLIEMKKNEKGDFIDLRSAEYCTMKKGDFKLINLGISIQLPKGYHAEVVPRSSTYKNFGIIMSNSIGIIDESYCGDNDIWKFPAIAMRDTTIHINDRICQFRIVKNRDLNIEVVDKLDNEDRGGIGSTGKN